MLLFVLYRLKHISLFCILLFPMLMVYGCVTLFKRLWIGSSFLIIHLCLLIIRMRSSFRTKHILINNLSIFLEKIIANCRSRHSKTMSIGVLRRLQNRHKVYLAAVEITIMLKKKKLSNFCDQLLYFSVHTLICFV